MADIAGALGKTEDEATFHRLFETVRTAFQKKFVNADGSIGAQKSQTAHLLALHFDLLTPEQRPAAVAHLVKNLEDGTAVFEAGSGTYRFQAPFELVSTALSPAPGQEQRRDPENLHV